MSKSFIAPLLCFVTFGNSMHAQDTHGALLSLSDATAYAAQNSPDVLEAQKEIYAAGGRVLQAGHIPNIEFSVLYNLIPTNFNFSQAQEKDIELSQSFGFPGKRSTRIEVAEHDRSISQFALERVQTLVMARVTQAYYRVLLANGVSENLTFNIGLLNDFLKVVTERFEAGASTYLDVIRTKVELTRLRNDRVEAQREQQARLTELNILMGRPSDLAVELTDSLVYQPFDISQDSVIALYQAKSALLKIIDQEAMRSWSQLSLAQKGYLPDFNLGVALQHRPGTISPTGSSRYLGFQFGVSVPLWFWQMPKGVVQEAEAGVDITRLRVEATRRIVRQRILSSYRNVHAAKQQLASFETSLTQDAEDQLRAGIAAYQNNQIDVLNLFDIYRISRTTKVEYTRTLFNYLTARAELESAAEVAE